MRHLPGKGWKLAGAFVCLIVGALGFAAFEVGWLGTSTIVIYPPEAAAFSPPYPECRVGILNSEYSSQYYHSPKTYDAHAAYWRNLVQRLQMPSEAISDSKLETGLHGFQVLVMPAAICLSEKERASVRAFLADGGGVICTWATGARDESGKWQGLDFLEALTGANQLEFTERPAPWYVSFRSRKPTTAGGPAGTRIQVDSPDRLKAKSFGVDAYWSDSRLFPIDETNPADFQGALIHNTVGRGRVVWLGFQENTAVAGGNDKNLLDEALTNSLEWTGQQPLWAVDRWPSAHPAAAVLACDVEAEADNAAYAASALRKSGEKGTFFFVPSVVKGNPLLVRQLLSAGEVASHGDAKGRSASDGELMEGLRLELSKWELWRAGGTASRGFHPSSETFTAATLRALSATHFQYLLTSFDGGAPSDSVLPDLRTVSQSVGPLRRDTNVVTLTRTTEDDLHYSPLGMVGLDPSWTIQRAVADFEIVYALGGLYIFNFHTHGFSSPEYAGSLATLIDRFRRDSTWIATAGDVAHWWATRSRVALALSSRTADGVRLTVKYDGKTPLDHVTLSVYPPADFSQARILAGGAAQTGGQIISEDANGCLTVSLGRLSPGTTTRYDVMWMR